MSASNQPKTKNKIGVKEIDAISSEIIKRHRKIASRIKSSSSAVGQLRPDDAEAIRQAFEDRDYGQIEEIRARINYKESYIHYPDLQFPEGSSVRTLKVTAYSSQSSDQELLHHLLGKVN